MTVGEKIREYRAMRGMTQRELGLAVGFGSTTADSRIRKYESDLMAPKQELREKIATALDVDISALSSINIRDDVDVVRTLFFFEENLGMKIEYNEDTTSLIFDNKNRDFLQLASFLYAWQEQKSRVPEFPEGTPIPGDEPHIMQYRNWKARFPQDLVNYWNDQIKQVDEKYAPIKKKLQKTRKPLIHKSEFIKQLHSLIKSGLRPRADIISDFRHGGGVVIEFYASELMNPPSDKAAENFAEFLCVMDDFEKYGMFMEIEGITRPDGTSIRYCLWLACIMPLATTIDNLTRYELHKDEMNDYELKRFEQEYQDDVKMFELDLKEEIELDAGKRRR